MSAVANAKQQGVEAENLFIKELRVDKGIVMKRMMPAAMGTGHRINKRTSHLSILLAEK
jgi:large subunit ribosomal protein L22